MYFLKQNKTFFLSQEFSVFAHIILSQSAHSLESLLATILPDCSSLWKYNIYHCGDIALFTFSSCPCPQSCEGRKGSQSWILSSSLQLLLLPGQITSSGCNWWTDWPWLSPEPLLPSTGHVSPRAPPLSPVWGKASHILWFHFKNILRILFY